MTRTQIHTIVASLLLLMSNVCFSQEPVVRVASGGIELLENDDIVKSTELIELSHKQVRATYTFKNTSANTVKATFKFAMPAYTWNAHQTQRDINNEPLTKYKLYVDDSLKLPMVHSVAYHKDIDITQKLRDAGLSDRQIFYTFSDCEVADSGYIECKISKDKEAKVLKILSKNSYLYDWSVKQTASWDYTLKAGQTITLRLEYVPFVGYIYNSMYSYNKDGSYGPPISFNDFANTNGLVDQEKQDKTPSNVACVDESTYNALLKMSRQHVANYAIGLTTSAFLYDMEYIFSKQMAENFTLRLVKPKPSYFVSLCFPGSAVKTNPSVFEFHHKNFTPPSRTVVHFYTVPSSWER